jgi:hypothetical protein
MHGIYKHNWYQRNTITWTNGNPVDLTRQYTNALYNKHDAEKMLSNLSELEKELVEIVRFRFGKKVNIKVSNTSDDTYTDGKNIVVSNTNNITDVFERLDILFGLTFHEISHCLYTDFKQVIDKNIYRNSLLKLIHNLLEDEEIENRLVQNNKGYAPYFAKIKAKLFGEGTCSENAVKEEKKNNLDTIIAILFCVIRYPKYISYFDEEILKKYEDLFIKINDILINCECPSAVPFTDCEMNESSYYNSLSITNSTVRASFEIYKYLTEYLAEDFEKEKKECEDDDDSFVNKMNGLSEGDGSDGISVPSGISEADPNDVFSKIDTAFGAPMPHNDTYEGSAEGDEVSTLKDKVRTPNPERYNTFFAQMKQYVPIVERAIIPNDVKIKDNLVLNRFRRNGNLDTRRLADAMQNINTVYEQRLNQPIKVQNEGSKYAFVIMIDESGSMLTYDRRNEFAVKTAILFTEVLSKFKGIDLYVYGHGDKINTYYTKEHKNKYVLANYDKQGGQNEVFSYNYIINDVKRQTNLPIVVLNITDFYYHSQDNDMIKMFRNFQKGNVSFNMMCLGVNHTQRELNITKRILDGQVIPLNDVNNPESIKTALIELSDIIKKNYDKFNKK